MHEMVSGAIGIHYRDTNIKSGASSKRTIMPSQATEILFRFPVKSVDPVSCKGEDRLHANQNALTKIVMVYFVFCILPNDIYDMDHFIVCQQSVRSIVPRLNTAEVLRNHDDRSRHSVGSPTCSR